MQLKSGKVFVYLELSLVLNYILVFCKCVLFIMNIIRSHCV